MVVACILVYNEEHTLPIALGQIIEDVPKIVIINGSPDGPSTDGTKAIIESFQQKYPGKIVYAEGTYGTHTWETNWDRLQRNEYLKYLQPGDWLWQVDCDEWYKKDDVKKIIERVNILPEDAVLVYFSCVHFSRDAHHRVPAPHGYREHRFTKFQKGGHYADNSTHLFAADGDLMALNGSEHEWYDIIRYHYAWAGPWWYVKRKIAKFVKRGEERGYDISKYDEWEDPRKAPQLEALALEVEYTGDYPELMAEALRNNHPVVM